MTERELLAVLDEAANYQGYPEGYHGSWKSLCRKAAAEIRRLSRDNEAANWIINRVAVSPAAIESAREERRRMNLAGNKD